MPKFKTIDFYIEAKEGEIMKNTKKKTKNCYK